MRTTELLTAILATISYLETCHAAPLINTVDLTTVLGPNVHILPERATSGSSSKSSGLLSSAIENGVTGLAGAVGSGVGSAVVSGVESLADDIGLKRDEQSTPTRARGIGSTLLKLGEKVLPDVIEPLASDIGLKRDDQPAHHVRVTSA
ncbi:hypothetical protein BD289DRAFT_481789 [Coniella lustricola]|uniref:Uncharacterized protein n=1 Tax=Coniella lustricola TaxID=2025994 RepID=A0A2T3AB42_9PEZI|nr:hypothetical protein BD289DRAFT_481789 [Coniella lustricola]